MASGLAPRRLDRVVASYPLGPQETEAGHELALEIALAEPALRPEEPQVEVKPELVPELLAHIVGQLAAEPFAAHLDQDADLADGLRARCTELFEHRDLLLDGPLIILRALRPVAQVR